MFSLLPSWNSLKYSCWRASKAPILFCGLKISILWKKKNYFYIYISIKSSLQLSVKSNSWLHWFCFLLITFLCDWSRTYTHSQPIRCKTKTSHDVITSYLVVSMMCLILLWAVTAYRLLVTFSFVQNRFYMLGSNNIAWLECQQWIFMFQPTKYYISTVNIKVQVIDVYCYFLFPVSSARGDRVDLLLLDGILL